MSFQINSLVRRLRRVRNPEEYEKKEEAEEDDKQGVPIPESNDFNPDIVEETKNNEKLIGTDISYPLIPNDPDEGERVYAWAHITWDENSSELRYDVIEPNLSKRTGEKLERIKEILERNFDISLSELDGHEIDNYLYNKIDKIVRKYDISITEEEREIIRYYTKRDFSGLGKLQPLMNDTEIEDISCDGTGIPVYAYHRNPKFGSIKTNIQWSQQDELDKFVMKLAQRCGKSISVSNPLLDGALPNGSRVQATLATDIARKGSNFTIRRFTEDPLTPVDMMEFGTENEQMLSYLWTLVEHGKSTLVCGTTGAGKTSQLNALSLFIKPEKKIVSIEDTPELRLPHNHWIPEVARSGFGSSANDGGEVSMDNLLKESLRQRPEYIIVGEVRGEEAYILFQQMATGHTGLSTIHADSLEMLKNRLTTEPMNLSPSLIETLDCVMVMKRIRKGGSYVRRISGIYEVVGYNQHQTIDANKVFEWDPQDDEYNIKNKSYLAQDIADQEGISYDEIKEDLKRKQHVLNYMKNENIKDYRDVGDVISRYYSNPKSIMEEIGETFNSEDEELKINDA